MREKATIQLVSFLGIVLLFMLHGSLTLFPQSNTYAQVPKLIRTRGEPEIERPSGWRIPGRNEFSNLAEIKETLASGIKIKKKLYSKITDTEPLVDLDTYDIASDGHVIINSTLCVVRSLSSYAVQDRPFAYEVALVPVSVDVDGTRNYVGAVFVIRYFDGDGNGTFERRQTNRDELEVPRWAKSKR